ncbi:MAG: hypothetical protein U0531_01120 [Dehalococcoidia bacterium]
MERDTPRTRVERARRLLIWAIIVAIPWVPGAVTLAMILTGHLGPRPAAP